LRLPTETIGLIRSTLIGFVSGTIFLPVFFAIWLGLAIERDLIHSCDEFGTGKRDLDSLFVLMIFVFWLVGILLGYSFWSLHGAILANFFNGAVGGGLLGYWMHLQQSSAR
jgi:hypothetical protein